jgi:hypothetical protein
LTLDDCESPLAAKELNWEIIGRFSLPGRGPYRDSERIRARMIFRN